MPTFEPPARPVIGVAATVRTLDLPFASLDAHTVFAEYVGRVVDAGGAPVLLPVVDPELAGPLVAAVDALVLTGGADVTVDPDRDRFELALVHAARSAGTPVLGVCRGLHVLNVAAGGTLHAHIDHHLDPEVRHPLAVDPTTTLATVVGPTITTGSLHHQAVDRLGAGLRVAATAPDGTIEVIEADDGAPVLGVQWHPELETGAAGDPLWRWLVAAARRATTAAAVR